MMRTKTAPRQYILFLAGISLTDYPAETPAPSLPVVPCVPLSESLDDITEEESDSSQSDREIRLEGGSLAHREIRLEGGSLAHREIRLDGTHREIRLDGTHREIRLEGGSLAHREVNDLRALLGIHPEPVAAPAVGESCAEEEITESIPQYYTGRASWPSSTRLLCWNCSCPFGGFPWFVPLASTRLLIPEENSRVAETNDEEEALVNLKKNREVKALKAYGNFCSASCAKAYINQTNDKFILNRPLSLQLLQALYRELTGNSALITEADNKSVMIRYSGAAGISTQEYHQRLDSV